MDINHIKILLKKYQQGLCTPEEVALIEGWIDSVHINVGEGEKNIEEHLIGLKGEIDQKVRRKRLKIWGYLKVAAMLVLISTGGMILYTGGKKTEESKKNLALISRKVHKGWVTVTTPKGIRSKFLLPDGSYVILNASSRIQYPVTFSRGRRPVYLMEGEAYFAVAKDHARPFTVYTSRFATTALGTAFNVKCYRREQVSSIALIRGKVRVDDFRPANSIGSRILIPHQQLVFKAEPGAIVQKLFKSESAVAGWKDGILNFDDASVTEVIVAIENRFNVKILNKNPHNDWKYTGSFREETLSEVLQTICLTEGTSFTMLTQDSIQIN